MDIYKEKNVDKPFQLIIQQIKDLPDAWKIPLVVFISGRLFFSLWGAIIWAMGFIPKYQGYYYYNITPILDGLPGALLGMWQRWDAIHYLRIALFGYTDAQLTAFFPLLPFVSRLVSYIFGGDVLFASILVTNSAFFISLRLLYGIVEELFSADTASNTLFYVIIFPTAFFFYSIYPQSLLLMLVLIAYWCARHGKWTVVLFAGFFAGLTHPTSVVLSLLIGWEAVRTIARKEPGNRIPMVLAPFMNLIGTGSFFLWRNMAGFASYQEVQQQMYSINIHFPWEGMAAIVSFIMHLPLKMENFVGWIYIFIFLVILGLTLVSITKVPWAMWIYQFGVILLILSIVLVNDPLLGILRYPLIMFPIFIEMALLIKRKGMRLIVFSSFTILSMVCSAMFFLWKGGFS